MCPASSELSYQGTPAAPGLAVGPSFLYHDPDFQVPCWDIDDPVWELTRFEAALERARGKLLDLKEKAEKETGDDVAAIFDAHILFLDDPALMRSVHTAVHERLMNIEAAWDGSIEGYAQKMEALGDETFRARAMDIRDVGKLVLRILLEIDELDLSSLVVPSVILANDLTPSATVCLDKGLVLAFCTSAGGPTSHTAILARALGIPAVVGIGPEILDIPNGVDMLVDGDRGQVVVRPDAITLDDFLKRQEQGRLQFQIEYEQAMGFAIGLDGHRVEVVANVGSLEDAKSAIDHGAEGIGLLRTEFLYLDRATAPGEEEQLAAYKAILDVMEDRPVVVRTLDAGGDKELPHLDLGKEANPFLGLRALRMCLAQPEFFKVQLRALLRASPGHDLRIMFPMVAALEEVRQAKTLLQEAREDVESAGHAVAEAIQVGIMVEVPSVALMADRFAQEVDFFSVGTNDLTQYTLAADRTNAKVAYLNDACHPAVLMQIRAIVEEGHETGIWVGVCGELAGDPIAVPILLGLGIDELSMAPKSIPPVKAILRRWSMVEAQRLAFEVIHFDTARAVRDFVKAYPLG